MSSKITIFSPFESSLFGAKIQIVSRNPCEHANFTRYQSHPLPAALRGWNSLEAIFYTIWSRVYTYFRNGGETISLEYYILKSCRLCRFYYDTSYYDFSRMSKPQIAYFKNRLTWCPNRFSMVKLYNIPTLIKAFIFFHNVKIVFIFFLGRILVKIGCFNTLFVQFWVKIFEKFNFLILFKNIFHFLRKNSYLH